MIWYVVEVIWYGTRMISHHCILYIYVINMMRYQYDKIWVCLWNDIFWYQCRYDDSLIWCEHIVKSGWIDISKIMNSGMNIFLIQNGMMSVTWYTSITWHVNTRYIYIYIYVYMYMGGHAIVMGWSKYIISDKWILVSYSHKTCH